MRNEIQVWLSIIYKTLQQSLTKALEILRRATTQFLNRTPALIREASQYAGVPNPIRVLDVQTSSLEEVSAVISCLVMVCSCYSSIVIAGRGSRIPPRRG